MPEWDEFSERLRDLETAEHAPEFISPFLALPLLRGFWPMSSTWNAGGSVDLSVQGRSLTYNGNPTYNCDGLVPYIDLDGTGDFLNRADEPALDILGTEAWVAAAAQGLTIGCWTQTSVAATAQSIFGKWNTVGDNRSYELVTTAADRFQFQITNLGTLADVDAITDSVDYDVDEWYFIVGRFEPNAAGGAAIYIDVNGRTTTLAAGIPASLFNSNADLVIGASDNGAADLYTGYVSLAFLCASCLSIDISNSLFQQTRGAFGI